ncbi:penicillin-binding protein activator [Zobellella maritima]|uniref:penicillin-binding protein activator n=1 Tax=Zobellella maritima TaxID=2059725 RepID=UPI00130067C3|nr:penicillin-binding protein activator [Zobellella maritima]
MAKHIQRGSVSRLLCTMVLSSSLLACGAIEPTRVSVQEQTAPEVFSAIDRPAQQYHRLSDRAPQQALFAWQALAIRAYLQQGEPDKAEALLAQLPLNANTPTQQAIALLLQANWAESSNRPELAEQSLNQLDTAALPETGLSLLLSTQGLLLEKQGQPLAAVRQYIALHRRLSGTEADHIRERIYRLLAEQSPASLRMAQKKDDGEATRGWFELMAIVNNQALQAAPRQWQLESWSQLYPSHPGAIFLPPMPDQPRQALYQPDHIAVLLPLSGRLAEQAEAIRTGMMHAHGGQGAQLSFIDTNDRSIDTVYQQVQALGADFIVGPLLKENVEALLALQPTLPVLALNEPAHKPELTHTYYFSLSPEADTVEVAHHMWEQGHRHPLVFAPDHELGRRIANQFDLLWQQLSGTPATLAYFGDKDKVEQDIRAALATSAPPDSNGRQVQPGNDPDWVSATNAPVDALFLVTNATETQITLPYFHLVQDSQGAARLPAYVISRSYVPEGATVREFNGLQLADMPWMLEASPQLKEEISESWPQASSSWLRLFAFGHDALASLPQLGQLRASSEQLPALTGLLNISPDGTLQRSLQWAIYQDGRWLPAR